MIFKMGELFCGPGGLALGAKKAAVYDQNGELFKIEHVWANDNDKWACLTYKENICPNSPDSVECQDVRTLDIDSLPAIDALAFGFPCNDYSIVGEHRGLNGDYGPLYMYGVKAINAHNPRFFIAENVSGLQSANDGQAFLNILQDLSNSGSCGYSITTHLYKFEQYGVPQRRHRIIIIGIRRDLNLRFEVPAPTHSQGKYKSVRSALESPPIPANAHNHEFTNHSAKVVKMLKYIPPGENAWSNEIPEDLRLNVEGARLSQIYKRFKPDEPAYTITGSGGGGTHGYHWNEPRALTNRERARIQTFPDSYIFYGLKEAVRKQIGMAVPPSGAEIIFNAVLSTFAGVKYPSIDPTWNYQQESRSC